MEKKWPDILQKHLKRIDGQILALIGKINRKEEIWEILCLAKAIKNSYRNFYHLLLTYYLSILLEKVGKGDEKEVEKGGSIFYHLLKRFA